mmetsp:Transcript_109450/g.349227  ORF Transcript_109450/g.349227 Transcript_109450/m.349227 type:complete len:240 (-) Transcript_109450:1966-2685(-)
MSLSQAAGSRQWSLARGSRASRSSTATARAARPRAHSTTRCGAPVCSLRGRQGRAEKPAVGERSSPPPGPTSEKRPAQRQPPRAGPPRASVARPARRQRRWRRTQLQRPACRRPLRREAVPASRHPRRPAPARTARPQSPQRRRGCASGLAIGHPASSLRRCPRGRVQSSLRPACTGPASQWWCGCRMAWEFPGGRRALGLLGKGATACSPFSAGPSSVPRAAAPSRPPSSRSSRSRGC